MKVVKKTAEYTVFQRRDGRHAVRAGGKWVNGDDKVEILYNEELLKRPEPKAEEPAEEAAEEATDENSEAAAE